MDMVWRGCVEVPRAKPVVMMNDAQRQLVEDNHNLIYSYLHTKRLNTEEWYDLLAIGLCKAAIDYDPALSAFSTFAYTVMRNITWKEFRDGRSVKRTANHTATSLDIVVLDESHTTILDLTADTINIEEEIVAKLTVTKALSRVSERDAKCIKLITSGYRQQDIGDILGISQVQVSRIKTKFITKLKMGEAR